jgi:hypothetical protein
MFGQAALLQKAASSATSDIAVGNSGPASNLKLPPTSNSPPVEVGVQPESVSSISPEELKKYVVEAVVSETFLKSYKKERCAPLPILAVAKFISERVVPKQLSSSTTNDHVLNSRANRQMAKFHRYFPPRKLEMIIPRWTGDGCIDPNYCSIEEQKLLYVHWEVGFPGLKLNCTRDGCTGHLIHDRTNFSKNKNLFPIFNLDGPPTWAIVMSYTCSLCKTRVNGNDGRLIYSLPEYIRDAYPVLPRYATGNFHISRSSSDLLEEVIMTYGNGDFVSRLLYGAINKDYLRRLELYLSHWKEHNGDGLECKPFPKKDSEYLTRYPPYGDSLRKLYDHAARSPLNYGGVSDVERHTREIQSVGCKSMFAQDHTMEVVKNYRSKEMGAYACWDCAVETGEIACAVLVPSTKVSDLAHAAEALRRRPNFNAQAMYSDTWPNKDEFWHMLFGDKMTGRLGLFHFMQRIVKSLRSAHIDYRVAIRDLQTSIYSYHEEDYEKLIKALQEGTMSTTGKKYSLEEINQMKLSSTFKTRYHRWLRKRILPPETIRERLKGWFNRFKVHSSDPDGAPGEGRLDPNTGKKLFTPDTKGVVQECLKNAEYLQDPLPVDNMYRALLPSRFSKHGLTEYISLRVESKLEGFHDPLSHFGNSSMRSSLCDALNLAGTARYNLNIRHKIRISQQPLEVRQNMPSCWEVIPSYYNHVQLVHLNRMAVDARYPDDVVPFPFVEALPPDNGERFFSEYLLQLKEIRQQYRPHRLNDRCQCLSCASNPIPLSHEPIERRDQISPHPPVEDARLIIAEEEPGVVVLPTVVATTVGAAVTFVPVHTTTRRRTIDMAFRESGVVAMTLPTPTLSILPALSPVAIHTSAERLPPSLQPSQGHQAFPHPFPLPLPPARMMYSMPHQQQALPPIIPLNMVPPPQNLPRFQRPYCCQKFVTWSLQANRNGRPPHEESCYNRSCKKQKAAGGCTIII